MKLHLPVRLFKSILSCLIPVACLTVGSGVVMAEEQASIILGEQEKLTIDYADADTLQDVGGIPQLMGGTQLELSNCGVGDGRTYTLLTGVSRLLDSEGNELALDLSNNAVSLYFDTTKPGVGFWADATLQLTTDGTLQLVRYTDITIPTGYARTVEMDEPSDFTRYAGLTQDVAFRLAADVAFDASAAVMTNLAASRYFTSASADAPTAIAFRNSENRMFYVEENETLIMTALRAVTFEDLAVSADEAISGGAIYASDNSGITLEDNGAVIFSGTTLTANGAAARGGALYAAGRTSPVVLNGNGSVEFLENSVVGSSFTYGGAIFGPGTVTLSDNGSVTFSGNTASASSASSSDDARVYTYGGAICGDRYSYSTITLSGNGSVEFSGNTAASFPSFAYRGYARGGAIYGGTVTLSENGSVSFCENTAVTSSGFAYGGAIYGGTVTLSKNGSVSFCENTASYLGGAISCDGTVTLSKNGSVSFCENTASNLGGAIYGGTVTLSGNGSVEFCANSSVGYGGAIYTYGSVTIAGNDEVTFARNVEKSDSNYRLRSLYLESNSSADKLTLSAGKGQSISFYDSVFYRGAKGSVALNADYTDAEGVTQKANGTILFSGATTENDLKTAKNGVAGTETEILNSRTSELNSAATLYGGTLQVQDKAVLKLNGGLTVAEGSTATMQVQEGATLNLSSMTIVKDAQARIEVSGGSAMTASGQVSVAEGGLSSLKVQDSRVDWEQSSLALSSGNRIELQDNAEFNLSSMTIAKDAQASIAVSGGSAMTASGQVSVTAGGSASLQVQKSELNLNGGLTVAEGSTATMQVQDGATLNLSSMTIAKDAQASIELSGDSVMTASRQVSVAAGGSASLQVQKSELNLNGGLTVAEGSTATMQVQDGATLNLSSMTIAKDALASIELSGGSVMTTRGQVNVAAGGSATLKVQAAEVNLGSNALALTSGILVELQNGASLSLSELSVAAGAELKAGGYIAPVAEAAKPVAFSLEGIESDTPIVNTGSVNHLEGNLRLSGGSTLNLQDSYLTVSGDLVLDVTAESEKVVVELTPGIAKDELSQVVLFEVGGTVTFGENGTASDSEVVYYQFAEDYFTGDWISQDTWLVYDRSTNLVYLEGVNLIAAVPEPTSSTLSLLALAALAARRRRK